MFFVGLLFGLGFDTASEVALLAISAGAASSGLPFYAIISLPLLFAAGMTLCDTTDGVLMVRAYGWAMGNPLRRIFNITLTGMSVLLAVVVATVEVAALVAARAAWA